MASKILGKEEKTEPILCKLCDETAKAFCQDCRYHICIECKSHHKRQTATRAHTLVDIGKNSEVDINCEIHENSLLMQFCLPCNVPVCKTCVDTDHKSHKVEPISHAINSLQNLSLDAIKPFKKSVETLASYERTITEAKTFTKTECEQTKQSLIAKRDRLIDAIIKMTDSEIDKVDSKENETLRLFVSLSSDLQNNLVRWEAGMKHSALLVTNTDANEIIRGLQYMKHEQNHINGILSNMKCIGNVELLKLSENNNLEKDIIAATQTYLSVVPTMPLIHKITFPDTFSNIQTIRKTKYDEGGEGGLELSKHIDKRCSAALGGHDMDCVNYVSFEGKARHLTNMHRDAGSGYSVLTISADKHIVNDQDYIYLYDEQGRHVCSIGPFDYITCLCYKSGDVFLSVGENTAWEKTKTASFHCRIEKGFKIIRTHCSKTLQILDTVYLEKPPSNFNVEYRSMFINENEDMIFMATCDENQYFMCYSTNGKVKEIIPAPMVLKDISFYNVVFVNNQLIGIERNGNVHRFLLDGSDHIIGTIGEEVWGVGCDGDNVYTCTSDLIGTEWFGEYLLK